MRLSDILSVVAMVTSIVALLYARVQARAAKEQVKAAWALTQIEIARRAGEVAPKLRAQMKGYAIGSKLQITLSGSTAVHDVEVSMREPTYGWRFKTGTRAASTTTAKLGTLYPGSYVLPLENAPGAKWYFWGKFRTVVVSIRGSADGHDWTSVHTVDVTVPKGR